MFLLAAADSGVGFGGGLIGLATMFIGIVWLVFPFIVVGKFNHLIRLSRAIMKEQQAGNQLLAGIAGQKTQAPLIPPPPPPALQPPAPKAMAAEEPKVYKID